jgi:hypothetical protein
MPNTSSVRQDTILALSATAILSNLEGAVEDLIADTSSSDSSSDSSSTSSIDSDLAILQALKILQEKRYLNKREQLPKTPCIADLILRIYKQQRPREFRRFARMDPDTFDRLASQLEGAEIFSSNSSSVQQQLEVPLQLLIALLRFGHSGNGSSCSKIATMCGVGVGTVDLATRRVLTAIHASRLREHHIRWPDHIEKEAAKQQIEEKCGLYEWRHGWCMVDGTLIPLFQKPTYFGETFFDRKSNYSLNVQIINTPNGQIIDYASGFRGSKNDRYCFKATRLWQDRNRLLEAGEWCWADAGYYLYDWLILPYKAPDNLIRRNKTFNYHLSQLRIRSEHTIGYLKGRFQSLKELRVSIQGPEDIAFATAWVNACIILHAFCTDHEAHFIHQDWLQDGHTFEQTLRASGTPPEPEDEGVRARDKTLAKGKAKREELKRILMKRLDQVT